MNKLSKKHFIIYMLSVIIIFGIPIYTILINTNTLKDGTEYFFKIEAYDPYDMFRGNYLNIAFEENLVLSYSNYLDLNYKDGAYVTIDKKADGFAYFKSISKEAPKDTSKYFKTTAYYSEWRDGYFITTPSRYYINENKSSQAEKFLEEHIDNAYVKVRVKNGEMVIVGVYINDMLIDSID